MLRQAQHDSYLFFVSLSQSKARTNNRHKMQIILENISKSYKIPDSNIEREVLKSISLTFEEGNSVGIIGPSGSGKSTLLNIIGTLDIPDSGTVKLGDLKINDLNPNELAELRNKKIGFIFQMHHLLPQLNVLENVLVPTLPIKNKQYLKEATERAKTLLERVGLSERISQLPSQMSVGECQRTAVVRALINKPEIILADEPTGSLDQENAEALGNLLVEIQKEQNVTLITVTHALELAKKMDKTYKLINGEIKE
jgi:lipoprotein-releasing system ATP-binding protein